MAPRWGSLSSVAKNLERHGFVEATGPEREDARPERTTYRITLAVRSGIELAPRCLRDAPDAGSTFAAYEAPRCPRVGAIARRGARMSSTKTPGPVARWLMRAVMPEVMRRMDVERTTGPEQRHRIDGETPVSSLAG
ncbi:MAG: hypothetical protein ACRYG2_25275 [Janthinobacterium lividum]